MIGSKEYQRLYLREPVYEMIYAEAESKHLSYLVDLFQRYVIIYILFIYIYILYTLSFYIVTDFSFFISYAISMRIGDMLLK